MGTDLLSAAREYVRTKAAEGVVSISPIGLARLLDVDEWTATELLAKLQRDEHLVKVGGFVYCESCGEATRFEGGTIETINASAEALVGKTCANCGIEFPRTDLIEVRLSFFCLPAAKTAGQDVVAAANGADNQVRLSVEQLQKLISPPQAPDRPRIAEEEGTVKPRLSDGTGSQAKLGKKSDSPQQQLKWWIALIPVAASTAAIAFTHLGGPFATVVGVIGVVFGIILFVIAWRAAEDIRLGYGKFWTYTLRAATLFVLLYVGALAVVAFEPLRSGVKRWFDQQQHPVDDGRKAKPKPDDPTTKTDAGKISRIDQAPNPAPAPPLPAPELAKDLLRALPMSGDTMEDRLANRPFFMQTGWTLSREGMFNARTRVQTKVALEGFTGFVAVVLVGEADKELKRFESPQWGVNGDAIALTGRGAPSNRSEAWSELISGDLLPLVRKVRVTNHRK